MYPIVLVVGTRPEAIKLIPIYFALKKAKLPVILCATNQHTTLLSEVFDVFNVTPDFNLNIMRAQQDLFHITTSVLNETKKVFELLKPSIVLVHGDTTTSMAAALSAFYLNIPIGHVEAGLRTGNMRSPFPEEMNRKVIAQIATYHFAPTAFSTANLLAEGICRTNVFCTGNPVVDALNIIKKKIKNNDVSVAPEIKAKVIECKKNNHKMVLLTAHRRESFDGGLLRIFESVKQFALSHPDVFIFYPSHPNPNVQKAVEESGIKNVPNIFTTQPISYTNLIYVLMNVDWVATDSGGIQEEAVSLGKRVIALRDITERWEGVWEGSEVLVGTNKEKILSSFKQFYTMKIAQKRTSTIYGDGNTSKRIVLILQKHVNEAKISEEDQKTFFTYQFLKGKQGETS